MSQQEQPGDGAVVPSSGLTRFADSLEAALKPFYTLIGHVGPVVLGLLIVAMVYSAIGRRFGHPLPGSGDIIQLSLVVMTWTVMGVEHLGHERMIVDVLVTRLPRRLQLFIAPVVYILALAMLAVLVWRLIALGIRIQDRGEVTVGTLGIKKFPFVYLAAFGIFTLVPIYVARFMRSLGHLRSSSTLAEGVEP